MGLSSDARQTERYLPKAALMNALAKAGDRAGENGSIVPRPKGSRYIQRGGIYGGIKRSRAVKFGEPHAQSPCQILNVLKRDAARARTTANRPASASRVAPRRRWASDNARHSPALCRDSRPGCNCGSRSTGRSGLRATRSHRRPVVCPIASSCCLVLARNRKSSVFLRSSSLRGMRCRRFEVA